MPLYLQSAAHTQLLPDYAKTVLSMLKKYQQTVPILLQIGVVLNHFAHLPTIENNSV